MKKKPIYSFFKRIFDFVCSTIAIVVFALPMLIVAICIKCDSKGPVLFKQQRVGKNKKLFKILKFRSMYTDTDPNAPTHQLGNANSHITKVGAFIRKTSLDELPQLFNIWIGQMSIVGPRPALWNQDDLIAERDKYHANDIKPGLTGLAQISGRDELEIAVKGKGSKGNFPVLEKFARKLPIFPRVKNERSMLYIGNLVEFVRLMVENEENGIFWPQNAEYSNTSELVKMIAAEKNKNVHLVGGFTWLLKVMSHITGLVNKAFGNLNYA